MVLVTYESLYIFILNMSLSREIGEASKYWFSITVDVKGISIDIVLLETLKTSFPIPSQALRFTVGLYVV